MPRQKTTLSPAQKWQRTVEYYYFLHQARWTEINNWISTYFINARYNHNYNLKGAALYDLWLRTRAAGPLVEEQDILGIIRQRHRLAMEGDVFIGSINNGMGVRYPLFGVSSKGARLNHQYLPFYTRFAEQGVFEVVELPVDFIGLRWDDPAIGQFIVDFTASSRRRVCAELLKMRPCTFFGMNDFNFIAALCPFARYCQGVFWFVPTILCCLITFRIGSYRFVSIRRRPFGRCKPLVYLRNFSYRLFFIT